MHNSNESNLLMSAKKTLLLVIQNILFLFTNFTPDKVRMDVRMPYTYKKDLVSTYISY